MCRLLEELDRWDVSRLPAKWPSFDIDLNHPQKYRSYFCNIVFLSARPHLWKDLSERVTYDIFAQLTHNGRLHSVPMLIPGSIIASVLPFLKQSMCFRMPFDSMGRQKFKS